MHVSFQHPNISTTITLLLTCAETNLHSLFRYVLFYVVQIHDQQIFSKNISTIIYFWSHIEIQSEKVITQRKPELLLEFFLTTWQQIFEKIILMTPKYWRNFSTGFFGVLSLYTVDLAGHEKRLALSQWD